MELKDYQQKSLRVLQRYLEALQETHNQATRIAQMGLDITYEWDREAWKKLGRDPYTYKARQSGSGVAVPTVCFKVPTGGGKTLLAVKAIDAIQQGYCRQQTGLVLWIVPTTQIYRQTLGALRDRAHPYRQLLDLSSGGKTLILEKDMRFSPLDVQEHLVVLLLMLPSASRQNRETLRLFRDQSGFEPFFPAEDQWQQHAELLERVPNLDTFAHESFVGQHLIKTSLGNTLRLLRPVIILDEGHKAYSSVAQETLLGFNPTFILELSATPPGNSNVLVDISGQEVHRAGMIKLDIHLHIKSSPDWRDTLRASHEHRVALERSAWLYAQNGGPFIRPISLIQVERTGARQRRPGYIHAEDAREFLITRCGVLPEEIAVKSSDKDEIENIDLLNPDCPIRYIITRQALQEGWDCPFAYVLTVLTNTDATTSITQLVGRVLRQPYARKTGMAELDESYVYCFRDKTGKALRAVQTALAQEGLGDVAGRVVYEQEIAVGSSVDVLVRPEYQHHVGKVYLPCFVVPDGNGSFREIRYEVDVLSRVDWDQVNLSPIDAWQLNPESTEDSHVRINLDQTMPSLRAIAAHDTPVDPVFITRQLIDVVPSPWVAYDFAQTTLERLRMRYPVERIQRDLGFIIESLKKLLVHERNRLAEAAFRTMIERQELRFYLLSGCAGSAIPERIQVGREERRLTTAANAPLQRSLFEYFPENDFNQLERSVALYLDQQQWILAWYRNIVRAGYSIQGWHPNRVYPDFIALRHNDNAHHAQSQLHYIYVLETKGLHLKNEDTNYKQTLFTLCNDLSQPTPWDALVQEFSNHRVHFQVIFEDEWQQVINAMFNSHA